MVLNYSNENTMPTFHCSNVEEVMAQPEMSRLYYLNSPAL